jgi:Winged helix-turn helix
MTAPEASIAATERITMTMRELDRFKVIQAVADGVLKPWRAAQRLGPTTRQIRRLVTRLREDGPGGLVSHRRAKSSNNRLDAATANPALVIIRDRYADFGPTLACEKLDECRGGIRLAKETVRRLMAEAGLWIPLPACQRAVAGHQATRVHASRSGGGHHATTQAATFKVRASVCPSDRLRRQRPARSRPFLLR